MNKFIILLMLMIGVSFTLQAQTKKEKAFNKAHKVLLKEYTTENKSIKRYYRCDKITNGEKKTACYLKQDKEISKNLKWFDKKEKKLIKKYGDGVSVFAYKY